MSSAMSDTKFDVFLSFRGPDTREVFANHLHTALVQEGFSAFLDTKSLRSGNHIPSVLKESVMASRIGIPILSTDYAGSEWCLRELTWMVKSPIMQIIPVFYDVFPSDLSENGGQLLESFKSLESNETMTTEFIYNCKKAFEYVSTLRGYCLSNMEKPDLIREVVKAVQSSLRKSPQLHLDSSTCFGFERQVDDLLKLLKVRNNQQKVLKVGIHGMDGIGKTTLASIVCKHILDLQPFDMACIVRDVHQRSNAQGLANVQQRMLRDLFEFESQVNDVQHGKRLIEERLKGKNVLLLLDDIETLEQLEALGGCFTHFGEGARLLITTIDRQILNVANVDEQYEVPRLQHEHALRLFISHAFPNSSSPDLHLQTACNEIVSACEGLPSNLQDLAKALVGQRDKSVWTSMIEKLRRYPDPHNKLKTCYDSLDEDEKEIFQDISCFFAGTEKETAIVFWKELKLSAEASLERLLGKHMISFGSRNELLMHSCLRYLGRALARQIHMEPRKRTRLFGDSDPGDVLCEFVERARTRYICYEPEEEETLKADRFKSLMQLQLLWLSDVVIEGHFAGSHLRNLIWLRWRRYSSQYLPPGLNLGRLAILQITESRITHLWDDQSQHQQPQIRPRRLKVLVLSGCLLLENLPDTLNYKFLQILDLRNCESLISLPSMASFESLVSLNMEGCGVSSLPEDFGELQSLRYLNLSRCKNLSKLPANFGNLSYLEELRITHNRKLRKLISLKRLSQLSELHLDGCSELLGLPELPSGLKILNIRSCRSLTGASAVKDLEQLIRLDATMCYQLSELSGLESVGALTSLNLMGCKSISPKSVESCLGGLRCLQCLFMGGAGITSNQLQNWYDSITKAIRRYLLCTSDEPMSTSRFAEAEGEKHEETLCMDEQNEARYCAGYIVCSVVFVDDERDSNCELKKRLWYSIERDEKQTQVLHPEMRVEGGSGHVLELRIVRAEEDSDFQWLRTGSKFIVKASSDYDQWKARFRFLMHEAPLSTSCNSTEETQPPMITFGMDSLCAP